MKKAGENSNCNENKGRKSFGQDFIQNKKKMKKNMQRLGGKGGLSLESFAKAKSRDDNYNPALIKKQREFYKNAKYVQQYKKTLKQQDQQNAKRPLEVENETKEDDTYVNQHNKKNKKGDRSLQKLYEIKHDEEEKARMEREAAIQAKKKAKQQSEARRKDLKEKMYKKTKFGQPVMKFRIEHLLDTIQGSTS